MLAQLHLLNPRALEQHNPPQSNIPLETQLPITNPVQNVLPPPKPLVNPPPVIPPKHLFNPQPPVILSSIQRAQHITHPYPTIHSKTLCIQLKPTYHRVPQQLNCNFNLNLWRFPQNNTTNVCQATSKAAVFNKFQPTLPPSTAIHAISHQNLQSIPPQKIKSNHAATLSIPVNLFSTTANIAPSFFLPVMHPSYDRTAPMSFCCAGPLHPTTPAPAAENASLIRTSADAIHITRNDPLPEWKLCQNHWDPLQWREWYGQIKSAIDSQCRVMYNWHTLWHS